MNIQELAMAHVERIPAKVLILNNQYLGMVVQWEDRFYKSNRGHTFLGDSTTGPDRIYPDFVKICEGFDVPCDRRVIHKRDLARRHASACSTRKEACVLDVMVPYTEHVLPMIPSGKTYKDVIYEGKEELKAGTGL